MDPWNNSTWATAIADPVIGQPESRTPGEITQLLREAMARDREAGLSTSKLIFVVNHDYT